MELPSTRKCSSSSVSSPGLRHLAPSRVSSLTTNQGLTFQFLTFPPRTLPLAMSVRNPYASYRVMSHWGISTATQILFPKGMFRTPMESREHVGLLGTGLVLRGVLLALIYSHPPALWVLRITLTSGFLTLQRAAYFLFWVFLGLLYPLSIFCSIPLLPFIPWLKKKS